MKRCEWVKTKLDILYHDNEWGIVITDDKTLFEYLVLEGMQSGLSWSLILNKREDMRKAFHYFDYSVCSKYTDDYLNSLMLNKNIIRHKTKIFSVRHNAKMFIKIIEEYGSFYNYIWKFVNYKKINNNFKRKENIPSETELSIFISKDLKKRGFKYVGSKIIYSYLQAIGIINDHILDCFCYEKAKNSNYTKE